MQFIDFFFSLPGCVQLLILTEKIRVYRVERVEIMRVKRVKCLDCCCSGKIISGPKFQSGLNTKTYWLTDWLTDWLTVSRNITLTLTLTWHRWDIWTEAWHQDTDWPTYWLTDHQLQLDFELTLESTFPGYINTGTGPFKLGVSHIWDSNMVMSPAGLGLRMIALLRRSSNCKLQTHPLISEGALHEHVCNLTAIKILLWAPVGCLTPRETDRLAIDHNITLTLTFDE
jgi:hypothetical protein